MARQKEIKMPTPKRDKKVVVQLIGLLREPKTVEDLSEALGVTPRTVYRYLTRLAEGGVQIVGSLTRPTRYKIN